MSIFGRGSSASKVNTPRTECATLPVILSLKITDRGTTFVGDLYLELVLLYGRNLLTRISSANRAE